MTVSDFLQRSGWGSAERRPLTGDASARRYERLRRQDGAMAVLMISDPARQDEMRAFLRIGGWLRAQGLSAPDVLAEDVPAGLLLLEDMGDGVFFDLVERDGSREVPLYTAAVDMLLAVQGCPAPGGLVRFTPEHMAGMIDPVIDWYAAPLGASVDGDALRAALTTCLEEAGAAPSVMCLRDCHVSNLVWLPERAGIARVGVLDFQDAVLAHPAYDLVSLLQDARRDVPVAVENGMMEHFLEGSAMDEAAFRAAYAAIGVQRHLRIMGVFGRLALSFGKPGYLDLMPRVWRYLQRCLSHPELAELRAILAPMPEPDDVALNRLKSHVPA